MPRSNQAHVPQLLSPCSAITEACVPRAHSYVPSHFSYVQLVATLRNVAHQVPLSRGFSSINTGVGCHALLQGIFPTQG